MSSVGVVGPGAIGCVMAAAVMSTGRHEVIVGARTPFTELVVECPDHTERHRPTVIVEPPRPEPLDLVVLATKAHQTDGAQPWLDAWCGPSTVVAVLQNGVEHVERVGPRIGGAHLAPGIVFCPAERSTPGRVRVGGRSAFTVPDDASGAAVADAFEGSFMRVHRSSDWRTDAWVKLLSNCAGGAVTTLARRSNRVLADPDAADLCRRLMVEAASVGRAEGAALPADIADRVLEGIRASAADHHSSIVVDRLAGRSTEWRVRNEVVVRKAAEHGIDVPLSQALTTLLRLGEPEERPAADQSP
jgi:2-dehydropantoate 2-reductase